MAQTAADILVEVLQDWGVDTIFGLPGDGINGIMEALRKRQETIRFVQVRHEEAAAFMACGYAKFTGRLGVCLATSGPGGLHLLNGLYDAKLDGQPVLAITGMPYHDLIGTHTQQDVELDKVFADVELANDRGHHPMTERATVSFASAVALWIVAVVATVFFLRAAQPLLIPIALAVLISYALAPVVSWLERHHIPRLAGAGLVLLLILGASGGGAYMLRDDAKEL